MLKTAPGAVVCALVAMGCGEQGGAPSSAPGSGGAGTGGAALARAGSEASGASNAGATGGRPGSETGGSSGSAGTAGQPAATPTAKNVLFILVDDLGYSDIGAFNPATFYETPNVDRLASEGVRFTDAYAANPVCSPTRFSIMTGKYPSREDTTEWFGGMRSGSFLPALAQDFMAGAEVTLAEAFKAGGFRTAFLGKWHLGALPEHMPEEQGFDVNLGGGELGHPPSYFSPYGIPTLPDGPVGEYLPVRLVDEALNLLDAFGQERFLLYLSLYSVHTPLQAPAELVKKYQAKAATLPELPDFAAEEQVWPNGGQRQVRVRQNHAVYASMVESMDTQVGRLLDGLEARGLSQDTLVVFMADNDGLSTAEGSPTSNLPLRAGKGWVYEGGIREPMIIKWPGVTNAGRTSAVPVISTDFYPTLLEAAGLPLQPAQHVDGESLVSVLADTGSPARDALFFHYPHYSNQGGFPAGAIRMGQYKLVERLEDGRAHLYDLEADIGEQADLAATQPERVSTLRDRLHAWYEDVDAKFLRALPGGPKPWRPL